MQIHRDLTVEPAAHLVAAARATFQCLLSSFTFPDKVCIPPSPNCAVLVVTHTLCVKAARCGKAWDEWEGWSPQISSAQKASIS